MTASVTRKRILVWTGGDAGPLCETLGRLEDIRVEEAASRAAALAAMNTADGLITSTILWDGELASALRKSPRLSWLQLLNAGFDNVERLGVPERVVVSTVGEIGARVVAEHAMGLLLALARGLPAALDGQRREAWDSAAVARAARTLDGCSVGIVGFGHIGRAVASLARSFGAAVVVFARTPRTVRAAQDEIEVRSLEAFRATLGSLDALMICAPLNAGTDGLVDTAAFAAMKRGAWLVNVSRGAIVDTDALVAALRGGVLAGAALDVVEPEPLPKSHPLWSLPNVLITPHTAWAGSRALQARRLQDLIVENTGRFARGEAVLNVARLERGRLPPSD
ncbi:MAG: NAD(P)-dependent oxidoreductase [Steroidobacteraceae bacterium]